MQTIQNVTFAIQDAATERVTCQVCVIFTRISNLNQRRCGEIYLILPVRLFIRLLLDEYGF